MTNTQKFIELAIEGGYELPDTPIWTIFMNIKKQAHPLEAAANFPEKILLSSLAWQAVGKMLGWDMLANGKIWESGKYGFMPVWKHYWHRFIDLLAEGKDIEGALGEILA